MVELNDIRIGTKFRVTWAREDSGLKVGQIIEVDRYFIGSNKSFRRPRVAMGYVINHHLGYDNYVINSNDGMIAELKRISNHRGCYVKAMKTPFQNARYDARRMRRLARNACKFKKPGDDFYKLYKGIARNAGK